MEIAKKRGEEGWALILKEQVEKRFFPTFRALSQKKLNLLDQKDLARSWGLIKFFMARDPKKFCNFMRYTGNKYEVQVRALKAAFGIEAARFDDLVNEWIVATF
jgi:hypothetical protein